MGLLKNKRYGGPEKRQTERRRVLFGSWIVYSDGLSVKCQTRDISSAGARVYLNDQLPIPTSLIWATV
jgi:hypothetical protein